MSYSWQGVVGPNFLSLFSLTRRGSGGAVAWLVLLALWGVGAWDLGAQQLPQSFTTNVVVGSNSRTVHFSYHPIRSSNYRVNVQQADGSWVAYNPGPASTYLGTVVGEPGAIACGTMLTNGHFWARISFENGVEWVTFSGPSAKAYTRGNASFGLNYPTSPIVTRAGGSGTNIYAAEIAIDSGWNHFNACGQDLYRTVMAVEHSILSGNYIYLRDNGILHRLGSIYIRANYEQDPYHSISSAGGKLDQARVFLSANDTTHDVGAVADSIGGGVAWVAVIGTWVRYSANGYNGGENGDFSQVWRHEVGHNWGSSDIEGSNSEGATIMNGNALARFSGPEQNKIINHRNSKLGILDNLGPYTFPLPPRASMDVAQLYYPGTVLIDVLNNDHSGNGLELALLTTATNSSKGGSITRSVGTGPGGRDQLLYTPGPTNAIGVDKFVYRIVDSAGKTGLGYVYVKVNPPISAPVPPDFAGNVPPSQDLSWSTFKPDSTYDIYFGTDEAAVTAATTTSPLYKGRQSSLSFDPGLLSASMNYFWRVDVVMGDGTVVPGTVWQFATAQSPATENLLVHLTLDTADLAGQNLETVQDVAYPANNFVNSGASQDVAGQIGQGFSFNGTNANVKSVSTDIIPGSAGATMSLWMKTTSGAIGASMLSVEGAFVLQYQAGGVVAFMDGSSSGNGTIGAGLNNGAWHHVLAANDGTTTRVFIDGELRSSYAETILNLGSLSRHTTVGAYHDGSGGYFEGSIDDVCVWVRPLSAAEAYQVYTNGLSGKTVETDGWLTRTSFEAAEGFTGFVSPNFAALGSRTDSFGAQWQGLSGDVQIWNRSDIPPTGVQTLKLGDADAQCRIRIPGTSHGAGHVSFDYASFSSSSDCVLSLSYSNAVSGGWVEVWSTRVVGDEPWWTEKPWPTLNIPVLQTGDVDLLLKKVGTKGVLIDNFRVTSRKSLAPQLAGAPLQVNATAGVPLNVSLGQLVYTTASVPAPVFAKVSGPSWISVSPSGVVSGQPSGADYGVSTLMVQITDGLGQTGQGEVQVNVAVTASSLMAGTGPNPSYQRFWSWLAADNPSSPNGSGVDAHLTPLTRWNDVRLAADHHLTQVSGAGAGGRFMTNRFNGFPAINYTGTQNNWGAYNQAGQFQTMSNGYTMFFVARVNSLGATGYLFDGASGNGRVGLRAVPGTPARWQLHALRAFGGSAINVTAPTANVSIGEFQLHAITVSGTTMSHYVNGELAGTGTFNDGGTPLPMSGLILSADAAVANHLECDIAEILAYNEAMDAASRAAIEDYLLGKYRMLQLPVPVITTAGVSAGGFSALVDTIQGYDYVLETFTGLEPNAPITAVSTNSGTGGTLQFALPINPGEPQRFWRIRVQ